MSYKLIQNVTGHFIKEIAKDNYDFLVIVNPTKNMTVKVVNSTYMNKKAYSFNNICDTTELQELLVNFLEQDFRVKLLYLSLSSKEVKGSRKLVSTLRETYSNLNVIYFNHNYLDLLNYSAKTFTVEVLDSFGLNVSKKVTTILDKALGGLDVIVKETLLASSDTSDYIKNCVSEYSKRNSRVYLLGGKSIMNSIPKDILDAIVIIDDVKDINDDVYNNNVLLHIVENYTQYIEVDRSIAHIYCPILIV